MLLGAKKKKKQSETIFFEKEETKEKRKNRGIGRAYYVTTNCFTARKGRRR